MTEPTENVTPQPETPVSLRKLRHDVQKRCFKAFHLLGGQPGMGKGDQMIRLDNAIELLEEALAKAQQARQFAAERDFDAYLAAKAVAAAPSYDKIADTPEKAADALTFNDLIKQLAGETPQQKPEGKDLPPF